MISRCACLEDEALKQAVDRMLSAYESWLETDSMEDGLATFNESIEALYPLIGREEPDWDEECDLPNPT